MLKLQKLSVEYGSTLNLAANGKKSVVNITNDHWTHRAVLYPYTLDNNFCVCVETVRGGHGIFQQDLKRGLFKVGVDFTCDKYTLIWGVPYVAKGKYHYPMIHIANTTLAQLIYPYAIRRDNNTNKLDFKRAYGVPVTEYNNMVHVKVMSGIELQERSETNFAWVSVEKLVPGWKYYPFHTPGGVVVYRVLLTRYITTNELIQLIHGGRGGFTKVEMCKLEKPTMMVPGHLYYCSVMHRAYKALNHK